MRTARDAMATLPTTLSLAEARRVFLHAQGLARRRTRPRASASSSASANEAFRAYLARQGVLQLDSVNVLVRAHYMPLFSRLGAYDRAALDAYLWSSGETFEHWGHEASVMPIRFLPHLRHRMDALGARTRRWLDAAEAKRPGFFASVQAALAARGTATSAELAHLEPSGAKRRGSFWDRSDTKRALESLFFGGQAAVAGRPQFQRRYGAPEQVWGAHAGAPALPADEAQQALFDHALVATALGTAHDVGDHFRLPKTRVRALAASAVARGRARWVRVDGWDEPALLAEGATDPGRAGGAALLSPFDPVCWYRPRLLRLFGMHYRIEIYTPASRRKHGYYVLPFLLGGQMAARVDLKADRAAGAILVQSAWIEAGEADAAGVAAELARELRRMAAWLGLGDVKVTRAGTLAPALRRAVA